MDRAAVPVKRVWLGLAARLGLRRKTGTLLPAASNSIPAPSDDPISRRRCCSFYML